MWGEYYDAGLIRGYYVEGFQAVTIRGRVNKNMFRVKVINAKDFRESLSWWEEDLEVAKLKGLMKAKELGWEIKELKV